MENSINEKDCNMICGDCKASKIMVETQDYQVAFSDGIIQANIMVESASIENLIKLYRKREEKDHKIVLLIPFELLPVKPEPLPWYYDKQYHMFQTMINTESIYTVVEHDSETFKGTYKLVGDDPDTRLGFYINKYHCAVAIAESFTPDKQETSPSE